MLFFQLPQSYPAGTAAAEPELNETVDSILEQIRQKNKIPAICAAIVTSKGLVIAGAAGIRKASTDVSVTVNDKWHLGSNTKAMTATLAAILVEQGKLRWTTTLGEVFPELAAAMNPEMKDVAMLQLLSHRAGIPKDLDNWRAFSRKGSLSNQRYEVVKKVCTRKPDCQPGSKYLYSNLGYVIAGAMIEKVISKPWEEAVKEYIFTPLEMKTAGFGGTGTPGKIDQPWGHGADGAPVAGNGPAIDNPQVMAPAGCVHGSIQDWAKFITDQLRGARGEPALLKPDSYSMLHKPPFGGDYALGWLVTSRDWGGGTVLTHAGCNTMNYSNTWIAPQRDFAVLACVNHGGDAGFKATDDAIAALIRLYLEKPAKK